MNKNFSKLFLPFSTILALSFIDAGIATEKHTKDDGSGQRATNHTLTQPTPISISMRAEASIPEITRVIQGSIPRVGEEAYIAINPSKKDQYVLLVPTMHPYNWRRVKPHITEAIKQADILVVETLETILGWDEVEIIRRLSGPLKKIKELGVVREEPFIVAGKPWTKHIKVASKEYCMELLSPLLHPLLEDFKKSHKNEFPHILDKFPLDNVHPFYACMCLRMLRDSIEHNIGMDSQFERFFNLRKKTVFGLESLKESQGFTLEEAILQISKKPINWAPIYTNIDLFVSDIMQIKCAAPLKLDR